MKTEIKMGSKVTAPVTDNEGEISYVIGILKDMNKRYAKVEVDGKILNVGKTKIEAFEAKKSAKKAPKKAPTVECPHCKAPNELTSNGSINCIQCGETFDSEQDDVLGRIADGYEYQPAVAASGRMSCDNGDKIAKGLRGKDLQEVYRIISDILGETQKTLKNRYEHLNPGHQRMCLGNLLRGWVKRNS